MLSYKTKTQGEQKIVISFERFIIRYVVNDE